MNEHAYFKKQWLTWGLVVVAVVALIGGLLGLAAGAPGIVPLIAGGLVLGIAIHDLRTPVVRITDQAIEVKLSPVMPRKVVPRSALAAVERPNRRAVILQGRPGSDAPRVRIPLGFFSKDDAADLASRLEEAVPKASA